MAQNGQSEGPGPGGLTDPAAAAVPEEASGPLQGLGWAVVKMKAEAGIVLDAALFAAYEAASSPHSIRALTSDLEAFDLWCRRQGLAALPATSSQVAAYLQARAGEGAKPASLSRYKASLAKIHQLLGLADPTKAELVKLTLAAHRRAVGSAQAQARPLRFKGAVKDVARDQPHGLNVRALLEASGEDLTGLRDRALLSVAYDTGLRASELVAITVEHILEALDPEARLLEIPRSKGDQDGEGATAYLSPRSVHAITAWCKAAGITQGPLFRRVQVRRYKARGAIKPRAIETISGREAWDLGKLKGKPAVAARAEYTVGEKPLHPGAIGPIWRAMVVRAFEAGALPDLMRDDLARVLKGISAHSTRVGLNQDLFASGEDLAGIMDALRWKSPRMPLAYNRNLAAEQGAAGRLMAKLG